MPNKVQEFNDYRQKMNDKLLSNDNKVIKRTTRGSLCFVLPSLWIGIVSSEG